MAYQLEARETFSGGIKRIATEELGGALEGLRSEGDPSTVHDTRKRFKKLWAILRLVKSDLGRKRYREANILLRDTGRELSGLRDAQVLVETLETLAERFPEKSHRQVCEGMRKALRSRQQLAVVQGNVLAEGMAAKVATLEDKTAHWHVGDNWEAAEPNVARTYGRGLEAFKDAYRHPSDEGFHEWRKGVKDLWYHLRIFNPLWPEVMDALAAQASRLADLLGEEHDMAVLAQTLVAEPEAFGGVGKVDTVVGLIESRCEEIRVEARLPGQRLYAETPKRFIKRFEAYWRVWQEGQTQLEKDDRARRLL